MCRLKFPLGFLMVDSTRYIKKQKGQLSLKLLLGTSKTIHGGGDLSKGGKFNGNYIG